MFVRAVFLSELLFTKMHGATVKISCSLLCFTCKCTLEILIHKLCKKKFVTDVVLSEFLFTKMQSTSVKISCSLLCFTWKCTVELLIHVTNVRNIYTNVFPLVPFSGERFHLKKLLKCSVLF
jgi:hypothetical protein